MDDRTVVALFEGEYRRYRTLAEGALGQLGEEDLSSSLGGTNSIATLVWHISGNLQSRFTEFLDADGEKPWREREEEFAPRSPSMEALMESWNRGWGVLMETLGGLEDRDLPRTVTIRGLPLRVDEALLRSLAHMASHVGQIVLIARSLKGDDWRYLSIPPGGSAEYNRRPDRDKPPTR
jgi:hypothetical protein